MRGLTASFILLISISVSAQSGRIIKSKGTLFINGIKSNSRIVATNQKVQIQGKGSYCHIQLEDGTRFLLRDGKIKLNSLLLSSIHLKLYYGELFTFVGDRPRDRFYVETANAKIIIFSTKFYIKSSLESTYLSVIEGVAKFSNVYGSIELHKFEDISAKATQKLTAMKTTKRLWSVARAGFKLLGIEID